jgi:hypothetical protein
MQKWGRGGKVGKMGADVGRGGWLCRSACSENRLNSTAILVAIYFKVDSFLTNTVPQLEYSCLSHAHLGRCDAPR